jgi:ABC-type antimicrobial peptide transport system permease subunit
MTFGDAIRLALTNLGHAKLRSALTMLGVSIGIASLAGMVSLGVGLEESLMSRFTSSGMFDSITVMPAAVGGRFGGMGGGRGRRGGGGARMMPSPSATPQPEGARVQLNDDALAKIAALPDVKVVNPNVNVPLQTSFKDYSELTFAAGIPLTSAGQGPFEALTAGTFFANEQDMACMITLDFARRISDQDPKSLIGQTINVSYAIGAAAGAPPRGAASGATSATGATSSPTATPTATPVPVVSGGFAAIAAGMQVQRRDEACPIVGIVERQSAPGMGPNISSLMIPLAKARTIESVQVTNAESLLRRPTDARTYNSVSVKVSSAKRTQDVEDRIKALGFTAISLNDALRGAKRVFLILDIVLSLIGSIALTVSSLGIMNTMVMSILERTREIGIMKAIGGDDGDIRRIFLIEASVIGLLGGMAGVALGWIVGRLINFGANIYIESQGGTRGDLFSMPFWLIAGAIGFSVLVSLLAGSYPARRAARLDPIQALRHD